MTVPPATLFPEDARSQPLTEVFLNPGEFHFGGGRTRIRTLLGSCVAISLWHPQRHIGGLCHYMLPSRSGKPVTPPDGRYADEALALFDAAIRRAGCRPEEFVAKVFGGGNMFPGREAKAGLEVGMRNIEQAEALLKARRIPILARHLGGDGHRKLVFDLWSGDAWLAFQEAPRDPTRTHL
ncbi:chemotaxis protein [Oryzomicrobium terrae]|uniref:Probable chemoreceptor glutamine deamidase CheD n=1 Tax=Oryzomicrobium terrae TaxID=1735038 RepID=A0A5C1EAF0_9RHOO|nr:chemotaxis protein CheD [Oryzomicrobium terrae]QEL65892.1 chemotaxis protein [Oryzomicrobium terrae]